MKRLTIDSSVIIASLLENESRHMDALVIQAAREYETELITFDDERMKKYKGNEHVTSRNT